MRTSSWELFPSKSCYQLRGQRFGFALVMRRFQTRALPTLPRCSRSLYLLCRSSHWLHRISAPPAALDRYLAALPAMSRSQCSIDGFKLSSPSLIVGGYDLANWKSPRSRIGLNGVVHKTNTIFKRQGKKYWLRPGGNGMMRFASSLPAAVTGPWHS